MLTPYQSVKAFFYAFKTTRQAFAAKKIAVRQIFLPRQII
tara:strand:+ start:189 stop:308 length:120 start_codon:yes stop_codon:yes gene_type:complete